MMASTSAGSGWTTSRIIALAAGSVLLLISLAFIAGGGTLAWADQEQLRSGYVTTTTTTYSTRGYALVSDPVKPPGAWGWLSLLVDRARIRISSSDRSLTSRRWRCCNGWGWASGSTSIPGCCRAASSSAWLWRALSSCGRRCC